MTLAKTHYQANTWWHVWYPVNHPCLSWFPDEYSQMNLKNAIEGHHEIRESKIPGKISWFLHRLKKSMQAKRYKVIFKLNNKTYSLELFEITWLNEVLIVCIRIYMCLSMWKQESSLSMHNIYHNSTINNQEKRLNYLGNHKENA